jgi:hypothetical protein
MILHHRKTIFIHIPRCGGTSIEKLWFPKTVVTRQSDYQKFIGWHETYQMWMQHATMREVFELYKGEGEIETYFSFSFVRNPWSRALSDWWWMKKNLKTEASFDDYLNIRGDFHNACYSMEKEYRGDHFKTQYEYLYKDGECLLDFIGRFEHFQRDFNIMCDTMDIPRVKLPHHNRSSYEKPYQQHFTTSQIELVAEIFAEDIGLFGYTFE